MASLLRQIVAGPRSRHPEAGLDLCYVTDRIVATSGPSDTYPQRAYRNPLDSLVKWLDSKHGEDWAIWEFRAEGTGYPDSAVYNRIYHYPFPDHHPPPFALIPNIMASMRNWLHEKEQRVAVLHCKAGKGRSGTVSCSYLISEEEWEVDKALKRFTERRMRPGMGKGISIPSQLRWIGYVNRWAKHGKIYVERQVEVLEIHCWGLRDGVKIQVEGFVEGGKKIKTFHTFTRAEREIVRGTIGKSGGIASVVSEVLGTAGLGKIQSTMVSEVSSTSSKQALPSAACKAPLNEVGNMDYPTPKAEEEDMGKGDVVFRPSKRVVLPTNDFNIDVERRNQTAFDLTYVTAVAHVWVNAFFEGNGPEQGGSADVSGVFEIPWEAMDGIKGSSRKGIPAFDKIAVVWKTLTLDGKPGIVIKEPAEGEEVPQSSPANWKGQKNVEPSEDKDLGLRKSSPVESTTDLSHPSSIKSNNNQEGTSRVSGLPENSTESVRRPSSSGEDHIEAPSIVKGTLAQTPASTSDLQRDVEKRNLHIATEDLPGGKPESEMRDSKEHTLLHVGRHGWNGS